MHFWSEWFLTSYFYFCEKKKIIYSYYDTRLEWYVAERTRKRFDSEAGTVTLKSF